MKINKHLDFDSLLSKTASIESIIEAIKLDDPTEVASVEKTIDKVASDKEDAATLAAAGGAGTALYASSKTGDLGDKIKKLKKKDKSLSSIPGRVLDKASDKVLGNFGKRRAAKKAAESAKKLGRVGLGVGGLGALALAVGDKEASSEEIRGQIANEVERESTPRGGAIHRGTQGAAIGGLAGAMHSLSKNKAGSGKMKALRAAWHGTAGATWGGSAAAGVTYAKKKILPDSQEDKQRAFERKLEKRASSVGYIGSLQMTYGAMGDLNNGDDMTEYEKEAGFGSAMKSGLSGLKKAFSGQGTATVTRAPRTSSVGRNPNLNYTGPVRKSVRKKGPLTNAMSGNTDRLPPKLVDAKGDAALEAARKRNSSLIDLR
jgi:hypothetical protein